MFKKIAVFVALIIILPITSKSQIPSDFRGSTWGDIQDDVLKTEMQKLINDQKDMLVYEGEILGLRCNTFYYFNENKLTSGKLSFREYYSNKMVYLDNFNHIKKTISEKYGDPEEKTIWATDFFKDNPDVIPYAIMSGQMKKLARWKTAKTEIMLSLHAEKDGPEIDVTYTSLALRDWAEKAVQKKQSQNF